MEIREITGVQLKKMIIAGARALETNRETIDALNVFPVPDGDTGTNMSMTVLAAAKEAEANPSTFVKDVAKAASDGALRGARGNSGVITSQLFRGFAKGLADCQTANTAQLARACQKAAETAYKAVMKPKEGTILTVARVIAEKAMKAAEIQTDCVKFLETLLNEGEKILAQTTEMLPALKQTGVVDAGGQGLLCVLKGAYNVISGKDDDVTVRADMPDMAKVDYSALSALNTADIEFTYCTEFFINTGRATDETLEDELKIFLDGIGDSIVAVCDGEIVKIHVHTNNPGSVLERALKEGALSNIKIENMKFQHTEKISFLDESHQPAPQPQNLKNAGFVAVASGEGFALLFKNLGCDVVVEGGQSMNPSAEDILKAIDKTAAKNVFVFPNNKNIILTAEQAAKMTSGKNVIVLPTKSLPQGITALVGYNETLSAEDNLKGMTESTGYVHCGQITRAVRSTVLEGRDIAEGDILCMLDGDIVLVEKGTEAEALLSLTRRMAKDPGGEVISVYYGVEVPENEAEAAFEALRNDPALSECELELQNGGQGVYTYIVSIE